MNNFYRWCIVYTVIIVTVLLYMILDRMHRQYGIAPCDWKYNSKHDSYYCKHVVFLVREVDRGI